MKKLLMRYISIVLTALILIAGIPINATAWYSDVPANAAYSDALTRLTSLGIVTAQQKFNPDSPLTREQYTRMIVVAAGLEDLAVSMKGPTEFPDVSATAWSSGYINAAATKGYMGAMADGKFHPTQAITYVQLCAFLVRALGYAASDLSGTFPYSYVSKAYELGLTDGISLKNDASVPRSIAVTIVDRFLNTNMKQSATSTITQTFMESTGNYTKCIVFGDSNTIGSLSKGQVLTDKGTYNNPSNIKLELGSENYIAVKNGNIIKASGQPSILKVSIDQVTENRVSYKVGGSIQSLVLPDNITYYYQGQKIDFTKLTALLQKSGSIVFNYNTDNTGYSFAVVFDPVYSKPEIADGNFIPSSQKLGSINFNGISQIIRDGELIDISQIEYNDVVYQVTDIWGSNKYILAMGNKIGGKITDILPNRLSPKTLQIDSTNYDFSKDIDLSRILGSYGNFTIGNTIVISLGYDGKIVNVENFGAEDNSGYAVVLSTGSTTTVNLNGTKGITYTAKLLFISGITATYNVSSANPGQQKGDLVKYKFIDDQTISFEPVLYNSPGEAVINIDQRTVNTSYAADNIKIFNIVFDDTGSEVQANVLNWNDLPNGIIPSGKIRYENMTGAFDDINVMLVDDIFNQRYSYGVLESSSIIPSGKGSTNAYTIGISGIDYKYTQTIENALRGTVYKFKMNSSGIDSKMQSVVPNVTSKNVQAIDSKRIKINDKIYFFDSSIGVYYKDISGNVTTKTLADINPLQTYGQIALYMNDGTGTGKVAVIVLTE